MNNMIKLSENEMVLVDLESRVELETMGAYLLEGEVYAFNGEEWVIDWNVCIFYRTNEKDINNYIYFEEDVPEIAIANFVAAMKASLMEREVA